MAYQPYLVALRPRTTSVGHNQYRSLLALGAPTGAAYHEYLATFLTGGSFTTVMPMQRCLI